METQKYYTPTIDEFGYGFNYEILINERWLKEFATVETNFMQLYEQIKSKIIRVKCLDEQDILELGWKKELIDKYVINDKYTLLPYYDYNFSEREDLVRIFKVTPQRPYDEIFRGNIKNKSELKKIMQMLNIK